MKNPDTKIWMWQRLWKITGDDKVYISLGMYEDSWWLHIKPEDIIECKWQWLCPKPNLVLINVNRNNSNAEGEICLS